MARLVEDVVGEACVAVLEGDRELAVRVIKRDADVDSEEVHVEGEVIRLLALYQPVGSDLRMLCTILKVNNDLERIADGAVNLAERAKYLDRQAAQKRQAILTQLVASVRDILSMAVRAYATEDARLAGEVQKRDDPIDSLYEKFLREMAAEGPDASCGMAAQIDLFSVAKNLERIADHATNIAEDVIFLVEGKDVRHHHMEPA